MGQYKNIGGRRCYKSLSSMTKAYALKKAKERRARSPGVSVKVAPDADHRGYYAVYTCKKRR